MALGMQSLTSFLPHIIWCMDYQILGKGVLIVVKNIIGGKRKCLFLYPHSEKILGPRSSKVNVVKFYNTS